MIKGKKKNKSYLNLVKIVLRISYRKCDSPTHDRKWDLDYQLAFLLITTRISAWFISLKPLQIPRTMACLLTLETLLFQLVSTSIPIEKIIYQRLDPAPQHQGSIEHLIKMLRFCGIFVGLLLVLVALSGIETRSQYRVDDNYAAFLPGPTGNELENNEVEDNDPPPHTEYAKMARYLVHKAGKSSVLQYLHPHFAYQSHLCLFLNFIFRDFSTLGEVVSYILISYLNVTDRRFTAVYSHYASLKEINSI